MVNMLFIYVKDYGTVMDWYVNRVYIYEVKGQQVWMAHQDKVGKNLGKGTLLVYWGFKIV